VNAIADTVIHAQIYKYLIDLHEILVRIRANQGVSLDNLSTPPPPSFVPPFTIFAPWCFRALLLPDTYQRGKMYALRLLCLLTVRPQVMKFIVIQLSHRFWLAPVYRSRYVR
jgi:hypothetical protein